RPSIEATVTGTITTDGQLGALQPISLLDTDLSSTFCREIGGPQPPICTTIAGGDLSEWTPGSLIATTTDLFFHFGNFSNSLIGFGLLSFKPECNSFATQGQCGTIVAGTFLGGSTQPNIFTADRIQHLGSQGMTVQVPAPIMGAGLPGVIWAGGGLLGWWRR